MGAVTPLLLSLCEVIDRSTLNLYGHLRLLVGYLGEKDQDNWWSTSFFSPSSRNFLAPIFARTTRLAQDNSVRDTARRLHDEQVGIGSVFHLFRLPADVEQDLQYLVVGDNSLLHHPDWALFGLEIKAVVVEWRIFASTWRRCGAGELEVFRNKGAL